MSDLKQIDKNHRWAWRLVMDVLRGHRDVNKTPIPEFIAGDIARPIAERITNLEGEMEQLREQVCDSCSPDDYGWNYNAVEGRVPCTCISESGAYVELQDRIVQLEQEKEQLCGQVEQLSQPIPSAVAHVMAETEAGKRLDQLVKRLRHIPMHVKSHPDFDDDPFIAGQVSGWNQCIMEVMAAIAELKR